MLPTAWRVRLACAAVLVAALLALGTLAPLASGAAPGVSWRKDPPVIAATLSDPAQTFTFAEVMSNQPDPAGFGGFAFTVAYDGTIWSPPQIDTAPAVALFAAAGRALTCLPARSVTGLLETACASTGPYASGPMWTGDRVIANVTFQLLPAVANAMLGAGAGLTTTVHDVAVQVTNTCGQPLNDGSLLPVPGQMECQGVLLPGLAPGGLVLNPGSTTITMTPPPTPTATATATPTQTPPPTATSTPAPSSTARPTRTATAGAGSPTVPAETRTAVATRTGLPATTATMTATSPTPVPTSGTAVPGSPTALSTTQPLRTTTAVPTATSTAVPCPRGEAYWDQHPDAWPSATLQLGGISYGRAELARFLAATAETDASMVLAGQLVAAKFNMATGAAPEFMPAVASADRLLTDAGGRLPMGIALETYRGRGMVWTAAALAASTCGVAPLATTATPTAVGAVLGSTLPRSSPGASALPLTGSQADGASVGAYQAVIVALLLIILILVGGMARLVASDRYEH